MDWGKFAAEIAVSNQAILLYAAIILFFYRWSRDHFHWNTERWEGLVLTAFNAAEVAGFATGEEKLDYALKVFAKEFEETHAQPPSLADLKDAALDLARYAYEHKLAMGSNTPAPAPASAPVPPAPSV
jgi:hypothetical protein